MSNLSVSYLGLKLKTPIKIGRLIAAIIEESEIYRVIKAHIPHTATHNSIDIGDMARNTPALVATPLPPLKSKKIVQL